jgi:hypothetical protein
MMEPTSDRMHSRAAGFDSGCTTTLPKLPKADGETYGQEQIEE